MAITFARHRIRLAIDATSVDDAKDVMTGSTPHLWRGTDVAFEIGIFFGDPKGEGDVIDVSNVASLTLEVMESRTDTPVMSKTMSSTDMDTGLTKEEWEAGTGQHVSVVFANTETAPSLDSAETKDFYLVVTAVTNDSPAREITYGKTTLTIEEDGHGAVTTPPLGDPQYPTQDEMAAAIIAAKFNTLRLYNQTTGKYCHVQVMGPVGQQTLVFGEETT